MTHILIRGDVRRAIPLADGSVHCVICSPPYWGLRDYGTARWVGGNAGCDHRNGRDAPAQSTVTGGIPLMGSEGIQHDLCRKCGARRVDRQLGLEPTPDAYVAAMVAVFREVRRVLHPSGTLWLNIGDSYAYSGVMGSSTGPDEYARRVRGQADNGPKCAERKTGRAPTPAGLKPKDLCGIPWRLALALQADGWWLRSEIIWAKPNPMPESVTDRPTKSHEQVFLFAKSSTYFYDAEAVRESNSGMTPWGKLTRPKDAQHHGELHADMTPRRRAFDAYRDTTSGHNLRSVWTIPTEAFPGSHFATMPRKLVEPCIRAGTSEKGACRRCGAMWERVVERTPLIVDETNPRRLIKREAGLRTALNGTTIALPTCKTLGWQPGCSCGLDPQPCLILDPFVGSGTTIVVAEALGRRGIGIDLSAEYLKLARKRIDRPHQSARPDRGKPMPLFAEQD